MNRRILTISFLLIANMASSLAADFFAINSIKYLTRESKEGTGVWRSRELKDRKKSPPEFVPCLEVSVTVAENIRSDSLLAKAYFYDQYGDLLETKSSPSKPGKTSEQHELPVLFNKFKPEKLFFAVPDSVLRHNWIAVVVFGDKNEAGAACYPRHETFFRLEFPEKDLVTNGVAKRVERKPAMDPLIQHVVKTRLPAMPQITLFLRPPKGLSDAGEVEGVLALCVVGDLGEVKRELQKEEMSGDYSGLFGFANQHKLAILAWGSRSLWDPNRNFDELPKYQAKSIDESFDIVANAWQRGVRELCETYGIPDHNFLLWGSCASAQWAARLCLRKPDYFLAIHIHIPGSFDKPTVAANKVLWCLTTGELYGGYERSMRFVAECRKLGYPITFKAIVGLAHSGHPNASELGFEFFRFALRQRDLRKQHDQKGASAALGQTAAGTSPAPWLEAFRSPPFYGDIVNQEVFPADAVDMIPKGFRTPLPSKEIADVWGKEP